MPMVPFSNANVGVFSFDAKTTKPMAHYEFDLTTFRDPYKRSEFKDCKDGRDEKVMEWVREDRRFPALLSEVEGIAFDQKNNHGGRWLTIAFRDFHGIWKSAAVAELVGRHLAHLGHAVCIFHEPLSPSHKGEKSRVG